MSRQEPLIPQHGGYRHLKSFQLAQLVYDVTIRFCDRYIDRRSRTHDQMVQAARSGVQNIAEGSQASGTSRKMELKLTNVARASLEELRLDYEDFLRQRNLSLWDRRDPRRQDLINRRCRHADDVARWIREIHAGGRSGRGGHLDSDASPAGSPPSALPSPPEMSAPASSSNRSDLLPTYPELAANTVLVLIAVACGLLDRQIAAQARAFEAEGGFSERLYRHRTRRRDGH